MLLNILSTSKNTNLTNILLVIYIYMPFIKNIMEDTMGISFIIGYIITIFLSILVILDNFVIYRKVKYFFAFFSIAIIINASLVDYYKYVLVEGVQALISIGVAIIIINSPKFSFNEFIDSWYKFAIKGWLIIIIVLYLFKIDMLHYNVFTNICIPNICIIGYRFLYYNELNLNSFLVFLFNILIATLFAGRMSAFISNLILFLVIFLSKQIPNYVQKIYKSILILIFLLMVAIFVEKELLYLFQSLFEYFGISSRNINLIINYFETGDIHLTNRDILFSLCYEKIKQQAWFPNGFGVILKLTDGKIYYAHNVFLQLLLQFGIGGCIILIYVFFCRIKYIKLYYDFYVIHFLKYLGGIYFIISLTGSSLWIHYLSTIFIAIIFFGNETVYKNEGNNKQI